MSLDSILSGDNLRLYSVTSTFINSYSDNNLEAIFVIKISVKLTWRLIIFENFIIDISSVSDNIPVGSYLIKYGFIWFDRIGFVPFKLSKIDK